MRPARDPTVFRWAMLALAVHVVAVELLSGEPGANRADHLPGAVAVLMGVGVAAWAYQRAQAGVRAALSLILAFLALVYAGIAVAELVAGDTDIGTATGLLLLPTGLLLCWLGATVLWRSRRAGGRPYLRRVLIGLAAFVAFFEIVLPVGLALLATHRPAEPPPDRLLSGRFEPVVIESADGLALEGSYSPSRNGAAVVTFPDRRSTAEHAEILAAAGFGVLALDMRGYGGSEGDPNAYGWGAVEDIDAGVAFLKAQPDVKAGVGGLGLSVGGEQMLEAAAANADLAAVVSEGAGERSVRETLLYGVPAALVLPQQAMLTAAVALFSGDQPPPALDEVAAEISPRASFFIYAGKGAGGEELNPDYFEAAREPKELWRIPEAGHTGGLEARPGEYTTRVTGFLREHLLRVGR